MMVSSYIAYNKLPVSMLDLVLALQPLPYPPGPYTTLRTLLDGFPAACPNCGLKMPLNKIWIDRDRDPVYMTKHGWVRCNRCKHNIYKAKATDTVSIEYSPDNEAYDFSGNVDGNKRYVRISSVAHRRRVGYLCNLVKRKH